MASDESGKKATEDTEAEPAVWDEWAIKRDRELQGNRENDIREAMDRAGLKHVPYGRGVKESELSDAQ
eukprot:CAMPEP_0119144248 /NCGR_PEP_ID=MMETSP1310-20130426/35595_1 /TAXON_ID=464262 /ORGANISM="Genus nov. species nov., Strain RCC2339" /LENGTH=67 /DNA_ID=CAMNT_0007135973 /DNA_START=72 /DNA_END=272 /DNA_ORIENTATION=+